MLLYLGISGAYLAAWYAFGKLRLPSGQNRVLAFHSISDTLTPSISRCTSSGFMSIISFLADIGFSGGKISDYRQDNNIALTFDDGWVDFYQNAYPILREYGFSATVFIVTDYVGRTSVWDYYRNQHLNWNQIKELSEMGIEFGSHTASHRDLRSLNSPELDRELVESKSTLEDKLGKPVKFLSYPFGRFDKRVTEAAANAGYQNAYAMTNGNGNFAVPRLSVYLYDTPYSVNLKLNGSIIETCKDYINNSLAGGTITLKKLFPTKL
jgi:peptidoglycan/xylan/chitin deacetylase (PgdA/CDA1 family)